MPDIQMVDLKSQYQKIKDKIDNAILSVISSGQFIKGPEIADFQKSLALYLNTNNVICCANGTDALQLALMALGLQPGDEVITTNFTFIATVEVIALLGLKPVLTDVCPGTFTIDPELIEKAITPKTKAIIPVHLFGQCANMEAIMNIAKKNNLFVIEDAAQAIGCNYTFSDGSVKKAGTIGHIGCTSFFPSKNLGCYGDGGAVFTDNNELAHKISVLANHGMEQRYYHHYIGINSRLDTIQAAVLLTKLPFLNSYNESRQKAAAFYNKHLNGINGIILPELNKKSEHVYHQYTIKVLNNKRDALKQYLLQNKIPTMIYYPVALHNQKAFEKYKNVSNTFTITDELCQQVLSLPMHTELDFGQLEYICATIKNFFNQ